MAKRYFKYTFETSDSSEAIRRVGLHGVIVRTDTQGGRTDVYVAADDTREDAAVPPTEVSEADVTTFR